MHYYKRNLGDYAKKAGRLTMLQHGAYTLLIDACYDREQFPTLQDAIDWTWASSAAEVEAVEFVLRKFFALDGDRFVQKRIQEEIDAYRALAETNSRIAKEREANRALKKTQASRTVDQPFLIKHEATPNQEPITKNHKKHSPAPGGLEGRFEKFWMAYPRKVGKDAARKAFAKRKPDDELLSRMLSTVEAQVRSPEWQKEGGQFIPHPSTWLNQGRWEDVVVYAPADAVRTTVPARQGPDPNLQRIIEDQMKAVPPPADVREKLAQLRGRTDRPSH